MSSNKVFISSIYWGLEDVRQEIYDWASANGLEAWIFEKSDPLLGQTPPANIERVCLRQVDESVLYIAIFHQRYGSTTKFHLANVSLVDLEFFEAFKEGKPILVYILGSFTPEPELEAFIQIISTLVPNSVKFCETKRHLIQQIQRDIAQYFGASEQYQGTDRTRRFRRFLAGLATIRRPLDVDVGLRFLAGTR